MTVYQVSKQTNWQREETTAPPETCAQIRSQFAMSAAFCLQVTDTTQVCWIWPWGHSEHFLDGGVELRACTVPYARILREQKCSVTIACLQLDSAGCRYSTSTQLRLALSLSRRGLPFFELKSNTV